MSLSAVRRSSIWVCRFLLSELPPRLLLRTFNFDSRDIKVEPSSVAESLETEVASVDELSTLAADETEEELASMELSVEAKLCFEALLRSMLRGREVAVRPGLRFDVDLVLRELVELAQRRPRNLDAAVVTSDDARAALELVVLGAVLANCDSRYPCSSAASRSLVTTPDKLTKS